MKISNFSKLFAGASLSVLMLSCSKKALDEVNFDRNHSTDVSAKFILTDMMTSTAFNVVGGDASLYASIYMEHESGVWNQAYNAEIRNVEPSSSTTYNNFWNAVYANIKDLKIAIAKTSEGGPEAGNNVTCGIAKVLLAYNLGVLTDAFGDVPYEQTGILENGSPKYLQPTIDKQSSLYPKIQTLLDEAITQLAGTDNAGTGAIGAQDLIYGGAKAKWVKAAYGLKARYLLRTLKVSTNVNTDLNNIISYTQKSLASSADDLIFDHYDGTTNINPLFGISNARDMLGLSKSLAKKFKAFSDPRGNQAFMNYDFEAITLDAAIADGVPNGQAEQVQYTYPISVAEYASTAPTELLSYHEVMFIQAEAYARLNMNIEASASLKNAIIAAFANLGRSLESTSDSYGLGLDIDLSSDVATSYFNTSVVPRFNSNALQEITVQKYLGLYGASGESLEAYSDYRRLKALGQASFITLENSLNGQSKFPLRFTYGNSDVLANQNVKSAYGDGNYIYSENVWWAGGTR